MDRIMVSGTIDMSSNLVGCTKSPSIGYRWAFLLLHHSSTAKVKLQGYLIFYLYKAPLFTVNFDYEALSIYAYYFICCIKRV